MKTKLFLIAAMVALTGKIPAATTINPVNRFAWGANIGWVDWRADTNNGALFGAFVCSGYLWGQNVGWIHLGDGTPASGLRYQNNSATDYGVNHDGIGNLRGLAWGANIGWINFESQGAPRVDLLTGKFGGYAWSQNCGWISLSNAFAHVQTDTMDCGPDSDGDGIPDAWELQFSPSLALLNGAGDNDGDGVTNAEEFGADTNPLDPNSLLRFTLVSADPGGSPADLTWTSTLTRQYRVRASTDATAPLPWPEIGLGLVPPDAGSTTTRAVGGPASEQRFFVIEAVKPLSP